jgi:hypothetical protein
MGEPFDAIGFKVYDAASYQALAEEAQQRGALSQARRDQAVLHGCCWRLGEGLEVWTVLHESSEGLFYADCRPAFRGRQHFKLFPWEIIEYEEEGEAIMRAQVQGTPTKLVFELQNITEINPAAFRHNTLHATVAGLAYRARLNKRNSGPLFSPLAKRYPRRRRVAENDYAIRGTILSWRTLKNPRTTSDLVWVQVELQKFRLEVLINRTDLEGELKRGAQLSAEIWLQGHLLNPHELLSRYEGLDLAVAPQSYWKLLQRPH